MVAVEFQEVPSRCMVVVNYHYLGDRHDLYPGIHTISISQFKAQVEELGRHFDFITEKELLYTVETGQSITGRACLLTFDDGLREHHEIAAPILREYGVPALFFVSGLPLKRQHILSVHRIHLLRTLMDNAMFNLQIIRACQRRKWTAYLEIATAESSDKYPWDDDESRIVKYMLNAVLNENEKLLILDEIEQSAGLNTQTYYSSLYMDKKQLRELGDGFDVGCHGYAHVNLENLASKDTRNDIKKCIDVLRDHGIEPESISYPYGHSGAVSLRVADIAHECGLRMGFTMERAVNLSLHAPMCFARIDTNDALLGKSHGMVVKDGSIYTMPPIAPCRRIYVDEAYWRND